MDKRFRPAIRIPGQFNRNDTDQADRSAFMNPQSKIVEYNPVYWDDLKMPALTGKPNVTPTFEKMTDDGSGSVGIFGYLFEDKAIANQEQDLFFGQQLPHSYKEGTDIYPHIHWCPKTAGNGTTDVIRWGLEYIWANDEDVLPTSTIIYVDALVPTTAKQIHMDAFDKLIGTGMKISSIIKVRLFRNSSHVNDTFTGGAYLFEFDAHHQIDTPGSIEMLSKGLV